jgi:hypothetical protein
MPLRHAAIVRGRIPILYRRVELMEAKRSMSPRFLARVAFVLGFLEGLASVWGGLRIPGMLVVSNDAVATASNILANESLFRLGVLLAIVAVALNTARTVIAYLLFRPVGRVVPLLMVTFGLIAISLQTADILLRLPVLVVLKNGDIFGGFSPEQLQSLVLLFIRWGGQSFNLYLAFFGLCCMLVGYAIWKSTFLPRLLGAGVILAGIGYSTFFWPPLANALRPWNLALGAGELVLGAWLLFRAVNAERWREQARATMELEAAQ